MNCAYCAARLIPHRRVEWHVSGVPGQSILRFCGRECVEGFLRHRYGRPMSRGDLEKLLPRPTTAELRAAFQRQPPADTRTTVTEVKPPGPDPMITVDDCADEAAVKRAYERLVENTLLEQLLSDTHGCNVLREMLQQQMEQSATFRWRF